MIINQKLEMDLVQQGVPPRLDAMQNDANSRTLEISLLENGIPWEIPADVTAAILYSKSDGTAGLYDTMPDGSSAYTISGSTVTVFLAPQVLTAPGLVQVSVILTRNTCRLTTFPLSILVEAAPGAGAEASTDYYHYTTFEALNNAIGNLSDLTTQEKSSLVAAVNEIARRTGNGTVKSVNGIEPDINGNVEIGSGDPGFSPHVTVQEAANGAYVHITDLQGTSSAFIPNGKDGESVSVTAVAESEEDGGSNVVTFSDGTVVTIKNGSKGSKGDPGIQGPAGEDGKTPVKGVDYFDGKDGSDASVTAANIASALGYTPASSEDLEAERARIDALTAMGDGSSTGDAELQDIRVGYDGTVYPTAGSAVREQIKPIAQMVMTVKEELVQDNIWNPETAVAGLLYPAEGGIMKDSVNWMTSPFEFAKPEQIYTSYITPYNYRLNNPCWCAYDKDKNFISGQAMSTHHTFITPPGTCYVRVSTSNENLNTLFITPGYESDYGVYWPYKNEWVKEVAPSFVTREEFEESKEGITNSISVTNLFSTDEFTAFQYNYCDSVYQGGKEVDADLSTLGVTRATVHAKFNFAPGRYLAMARVKCTKFDSAGDTHIYIGTNGRNTGLANSVYAIDTYYGCQYKGSGVGNARNESDGSLVLDTEYTLGILLDIAETDTFNIDLAMFGGNKDAAFVYKDLMVLNIGNCLERADAIDILVNTAFIQDSATVSYSYRNPGGIHAGKTLAVIGDSITAGVNTANSENGVKNTYGYLIASGKGMRFMNFGMGGTTMTAFSVKPFCLSEDGGRIANIPAPDIDICLIMMGINDFNTSGFTLGSVGDTDNTTFYGAYNTVLSNLIARNPKMKIGLITPYGTDKSVRDAVKAVGNKYAVPVLDLYAENIPMFYARDTMTDTLTGIANARRAVLLPDGVHPNADGHAFLATIIGNFVDSL